MKIYVQFRGQIKRELTDAEKPVWKNGVIFGVPLGILIGMTVVVLLGVF